MALPLCRELLAQLGCAQHLLCRNNSWYTQWLSFIAAAARFAVTLSSIHVCNAIDERTPFGPVRVLQPQSAAGLPLCVARTAAAHLLILVELVAAFGCHRIHLYC